MSKEKDVGNYLLATFDFLKVTDTDRWRTLIAQAEAIKQYAEVAELERRIVETAVARRETERKLFPKGPPVVTVENSNIHANELQAKFTAEQEAVDALIFARKKLNEAAQVVRDDSGEYGTGAI